MTYRIKRGGTKRVAALKPLIIVTARGGRKYFQ
jgi:hypothetical protein